MANFVVLAEIIPRTFVVSAEIAAVRVRPPPRLEALPCERTAAWVEHFKARQKYSKALEAWCQAEDLVILIIKRTASACDDIAYYNSETAHHLRKFLARSVVDSTMEEEFALARS